MTSSKAKVDFTDSSAIAAMLVPPSDSQLSDHPTESIGPLFLFHVQSAKWSNPSTPAKLVKLFKDAEHARDECIQMISDQTIYTGAEREQEVCNWVMLIQETLDEMAGVVMVSRITTARTVRLSSIEALRALSIGRPAAANTGGTAGDGTDMFWEGIFRTTRDVFSPISQLLFTGETVVSNVMQIERSQHKSELHDRICNRIRAYRKHQTGSDFCAFLMQVASERDLAAEEEATPAPAIRTSNPQWWDGAEIDISDDPDAGDDIGGDDGDDDELPLSEKENVPEKLKLAAPAAAVGFPDIRRFDQPVAAAAVAGGFDLPSSSKPKAVGLFGAPVLDQTASDSKVKLKLNNTPTAPSATAATAVTREVEFRYEIPRKATTTGKKVRLRKITAEKRAKKQNTARSAISRFYETFPMLRTHIGKFRAFLHSSVFSFDEAEIIRHLHHDSELFQSDFAEPEQRWDHCTLNGARQILASLESHMSIRLARTLSSTSDTGKGDRSHPLLTLRAGEQVSLDSSQKRSAVVVDFFASSAIETQKKMRAVVQRMLTQISAAIRTKEAVSRDAFDDPTQCFLSLVVCGLKQNHVMAGNALAWGNQTFNVSRATASTIQSGHRDLAIAVVRQSFLARMMLAYEAVARQNKEMEAVSVAVEKYKHLSNSITSRIVFRPTEYIPTPTSYRRPTVHVGLNRVPLGVYGFVRPKNSSDSEITAEVAAGDVSAFAFVQPQQIFSHLKSMVSSQAVHQSLTENTLREILMHYNTRAFAEVLTFMWKVSEPAPARFGEPPVPQRQPPRKGSDPWFFESRATFKDEMDGHIRDMRGLVWGLRRAVEADVLAGKSFVSRNKLRELTRLSNQKRGLNLGVFLARHLQQLMFHAEQATEESNSIQGGADCSLIMQSVSVFSAMLDQIPVMFVAADKTIYPIIKRVERTLISHRELIEVRWCTDFWNACCCMMLRKSFAKVRHLYRTDLIPDGLFVLLYACTRRWFCGRFASPGKVSEDKNAVVPYDDEHRECLATMFDYASAAALRVFRVSYPSFTGGSQTPVSLPSLRTAAASAASATGV